MSVRTAASAITMPRESSAAVRSALLQRKCACGGTPGPDGECTACKAKRVGMQQSAKGANGPTVAPPIVHDVLRSAGQPLSPATQADMGARFGHDFGQVRVHTDRRAAESARAVNALAYTVANNVVFGAGQYQPNTSAGQRLLAHELTHSIQQERTKFGTTSSLAMAMPSDPAERAAVEAEGVVRNKGAVDSVRVSPVQVHRLAVDTASAPPDSTTEAPAPNQMTKNPSEAPLTTSDTDGKPGCKSPAGIPNTTCNQYLANASWLPLAYVNNATCACQATPNLPTASCVRKFLQDRLAATPTSIQVAAAVAKSLPDPAYHAFVQSVLTPRIYQDHQDAYASCCCPSGPASYVDWIGVTTVPIRPCSVVGHFINWFGSCHGTPGAW